MRFFIIAFNSTHRLNSVLKRHTFSKNKTLSGHQFRNTIVNDIRLDRKLYYSAVFFIVEQAFQIKWHTRTFIETKKLIPSAF